ncbi:restriction endonuclease subunit S [Flavisolibacter nicotianae]|uniref:restriction endonuclease subunit S n=1 Tax=Flavisolibacter nicotianae TaxID=2364882 RepID=UPI0013C41747|nr:restriction endonuclease subunit S [Flavisolibacter nicotianae]
MKSKKDSNFLVSRKIPNGWALRSLGEIAIWSSGGTPSASVKRYYNGDIPWVVIGDLNDGEISRSQKTITQLGLENSSAKWVPANSVLLAMYGNSIGKLGINKMPCTTNQAIAFTRKIFGGIPSKYIFYYLLSERDKLMSLGKGDAQQNISLGIINDYPIPLPSPEIQHLIVDELEDLLGKLQQAQTVLNKIPEMLKAAKQKVIDDAVSGALTNDWRKNNKNGTGLQLFKLIVQKRRTANGVLNFEVDEIIQQNEKIPKTWHWTRLLDIAEISSGVTKGRNLKGKRLIRVPYLRVANVQDGFLDLDEVKSIEILPDEFEKFKLEAGDILFTEGGDRDKLGRNAIWNNEIDNCIHQNHIFKARVCRLPYNSLI